MAADVEMQAAIGKPGRVFDAHHPKSPDSISVFRVVFPRFGSLNLLAVGLCLFSVFFFRKLGVLFLSATVFRTGCRSETSSERQLAQGLQSVKQAGRF